MNARCIRILGGVVIALLLSSCSDPETVDVSNTDVVRGQIAIIPQPNSVTVLPGEFQLREDTRIVSIGDVGNGAEILSGILLNNGGLKPELASEPLENSIILSAVGPEQRFGEEGYALRIEPEAIRIVGTKRGIFYGIQSLAQILPARFENRAALPAVEIEDSPRFPYRGMHLDVARHYLPPEFVKRYIDLMAAHKFNYFHWHLTDDQGWRIEIRKYPKLVETGSVRSETVRSDTYPTYVGDGHAVGGWYKQEEIRDIVAFARSRHVTIIPEIDVPGHSAAALAAYPKYGCKKGYAYGVKTTWGGFPDIYCPTPETFSFLDDIFSEVIELFPDSPYIHIGGDEVNEQHWKQCTFVKTLKRQNGLTSEREVQGMFLRRVANFLRSRGKRAVVWDEAIANPVQPNASVMVWRKFDYALKALRLGHEVIVTPRDPWYFDRPQSDDQAEPRGLGKPVDLERIYTFEPVPKGIPNLMEKKVIGGQACVWTEFMTTSEHVEYMAFPRAIALSEVLWSMREHRNFGSFLERLPQRLAWLDLYGVKFRIPEPLGLRDRSGGESGYQTVALGAPVSNGRIYYTLDGTPPDQNSQLYEGPIQITTIPDQSVRLQAVVVTPGGRSSNVFEAEFPARTDATPNVTTGRK